VNTNKPGWRNVLTYSSADNGANWSEKNWASNISVNANNAVAVIANSSLVVLARFDQSSGTGNSIRCFYNNGGAWAESRVVTTSSNTAGFIGTPKVVVKRSGSNIGRIFCVCSIRDSNDTSDITHVRILYSDNYGASWAVAANLRDADRTIDVPEITESGNGDVYVGACYYNGLFETYKIVNGTLSVVKQPLTMATGTGGTAVDAYSKASVGWAYTPILPPYYTYFEKLSLNTAPNPPTFYSPGGTALTTYNQRPRIYFVGTDADGNNLAYNIQVATDPTFASGVVFDRGSLSSPNDFYNSAGWYPSSSGIWWNAPSSLAYGTYYVRVRATDASTFGNFSATLTLTIANPDWTNPNILEADSGIRKIWIDELRIKINTARTSRGLAAYMFTDPVITAESTAVRAIHVTQLRTAIVELFNLIGSFAYATTPTFTDPIISAGLTQRKGKHIKELRSVVELL